MYKYIWLHGGLDWFQVWDRTLLHTDSWRRLAYKKEFIFVLVFFFQKKGKKENVVYLHARAFLFRHMPNILFDIRRTGAERRLAVGYSSVWVVVITYFVNRFQFECGLVYSLMSITDEIVRHIWTYFAVIDVPTRCRRNSLCIFLYLKVCVYTEIVNHTIYLVSSWSIGKTSGVEIQDAPLKGRYP